MNGGYHAERDVVHLFERLCMRGAEVRMPCVKFEGSLDLTCVRERAGILCHLCAGVVRAQTEGEA